MRYAYLAFVLVDDGEVSVSKRATSRENNFSDERCTTKGETRGTNGGGLCKGARSTTGPFVRPFGPRQH